MIMIINGEKVTEAELESELMIIETAKQRAAEAEKHIKRLEELRINGFEPIKIRRYIPPKLKWYEKLWYKIKRCFK